MEFMLTCAIPMTHCDNKGDGAGADRPQAATFACCFCPAAKRLSNVRLTITVRVVVLAI